MSEPLTIDPEEPANKGLDYAWLKAEGISLIQQMAGTVWTDYNESDPGVTTLEQLCYALTELSYRAEFPLADLLVDPETRRIEPRRQALFIPKRIFPCNPLTENDYRKLIVDRVPGVANAWLTPHRSGASPRGINGLYDISVYVPGLEPPPCAPPDKAEEIRCHVRRVYCRHRNLCEDVRAIRILLPVPATVHASVSIGDVPTPEAILAGLFFQLGNLFAPELRRHPLKSLLDRGLLPSEIFEGPLLLNGFIDDGELRPKAREIPFQEVVRTMARSESVLGVRDVKVRTQGKTYQGNCPIPVPPWGILQVDSRPEGKRGGFAIKLFRKGIEVQPHPGRVRRELEKLWADFRRTYKLSAQYREYFAFPQGRYRDLERYSSIQNQYPNVYGINAYGLPTTAPPARRGQARQLKGYLLPFEQVLANFFAQLARARDLFSVEAGLRHTYFYQFLDRSVPDVEPLLKQGGGGEGIGYRRGLPRLVHSQDPAVERRNRFLDVLLALYAEALDAASLWDLTARNREEDRTGERLIHAKLALLHLLVASTHNRGRGFDYLERPSRGNIAGLEIRSRIQLGIGGLRVFDHRPLGEVLDDLGVRLAASGAEASMARPLVRHADFIEEQLAPVSVPAEGEGDRELLRPAPWLRGASLPEEILDAGGEAGELRAGSLPGDPSVAAVWRPSPRDEWRLLGKHPDRESAEAACCAFAGLLRVLHRCCWQLYIVEHVLLRLGRFRPCDGADHRLPDPFVYNFTLTAVICAPPRLAEDRQYRKLVGEVIRGNTPSHIVADCLFLRPSQVWTFEGLYGAWQHALRGRSRKAVIAASAALRCFLEEQGQDGSCEGDSA